MKKPQKPEHAFASIIFDRARVECPWATFHRQSPGAMVPFKLRDTPHPPVITVYRVGEPDYRVHLDGGGLAFVEVKACGDVLSDAQRDVIASLEMRRIPVIVVEAATADAMHAEAARLCKWLRAIYKGG